MQMRPDSHQLGDRGDRAPRLYRPTNLNCEGWIGGRRPQRSRGASTERKGFVYFSWVNKDILFGFNVVNGGGLVAKESHYVKLCSNNVRFQIKAC